LQFLVPSNGVVHAAMDLSYSDWKASKTIGVYSLLAWSNIGVLILSLGNFFLESNSASNSLFLLNSTTLSKCLRNRMISKSDLKCLFKSLFRLSLNCVLLIPNVYTLVI
jgi:hypothetical protein